MAQNGRTTPRAMYVASFKAFIATPAMQVVGTIHDNYHGNALTTTHEAWQEEVELLQEVLQPWQDEDAQILFEYDIPRLGKRIDVVLLLHGMIFCLEFKVGQNVALQSDVEQVMDYALDLKNFHRYSHDRTIVPILIPTEYRKATDIFQPSVYDDAIYNALITGAFGLQSMIQKVLAREQRPAGSIKDWAISPYAPTPTIVEAARTLYANHSVEDITRHEADSVSTDATIAYILDVINDCKQRRCKGICFVTGVPGAGKTLVGLDVAVKQTYQDGKIDTDNGAVYLSGNGPLVAVLTEALARDNRRKCKDVGEKKTLSDSRREVSEFIQIIHRYRDNMLAKIKTPIEGNVLEIDPEKAVKQEKTGYGEVEHVAIFDEAQRSWTHERIANYLSRGGTYGNKLKVKNFPMSEAEFLIWSMDQREDWAVIVCLVGGGQEINTGEAGISEWINALNTRFNHWQIFISPQLTEKEYAEGQVKQLLQDNPNVTYAEQLHLAVSLRSFRAETLSAFIQALLTFDAKAQPLYQDICTKGYPFLMTRDMETARQWLRQQARGTQKTGVLVTKVAARFKPLAVHILAPGDENAVHWFLEDKTDVRSSDYLEDAATEIQVQGLELDYACVLWDADMQCHHQAWEFYKFNGKSKWIEERNPENRQYMLNAYRVLMTRARQGLIICIPRGNDRKNAAGHWEDPTRLPEFYDGVYNYFKAIGVEEI